MMEVVPEGAIEVAAEDLAEIRAIITNNYAEPLMRLQLAELEPPHRVRSPAGEPWVVLGLVVAGLEGDLSATVRRGLELLLQHHAGPRLQLVVLVEAGAARAVGALLAGTLARWVGTGVMLHPGWRWRRQRGLPRVSVSFVDIAAVVAVDPAFVAGGQRLGQAPRGEKYTMDLFYISPLYGKAFAGLDRILFIDTDMDFYGDVQLVWDQFDRMSPGQVAGLAPDLSPHYWSYLRHGGYLAAHPNSSLGRPGPSQGLNAGVMLLRLDRMRSELRFTDQLNYEAMGRLVQEFHVSGLAHQDWWTMLSWKRPDLFHVLPCSFNRQLSLNYLREPYEDIFDAYHACGFSKSETVVFHRNGCGPTPEQCYINLPEGSAYWAARAPRSHLWEVHLDVELFWHVMAYEAKTIRKGTIDMLLSHRMFTLGNRLVIKDYKSYSPPKTIV
jgi:hypothetical protein